jgi:hypothetical protein
MQIPCKLCRVALVLAGVLLTALGIAGCHRITEGEKGYSTTSLTYGQAMAAARITQNEYPGSILLQAQGTSMLPKYGNNTIFVVKPIAWEALRPGMDVAYHRPTGEDVVHQLLVNGGDFWIIKGINNSIPDVFHVTRANLLGQVWTAFSYDLPKDPDAQ